MKTRHYIRIVLRSFKKEYQTEEEAETYLYDWFRKKRNDAAWLGFYIGLIIGMILIKITT